MHVAHFNIGRLRALPGDPAVAEFIDNVPRVNAIAERSPGYVWRWSDETRQVTADAAFQAVFDDPLLAASLSVWETVSDLRHFVQKTLHGSFVRRRESWFEPSDGPAYVLWWVKPGTLPTTTEGRERLARLAEFGPSQEAFDFAYPHLSAE